MAFSGLFALIGLLVLLPVGAFGVAPMAVPVAGGFMLIGPALLTGFFRLAVIHAAGRWPVVTLPALAGGSKHGVD